MIAAPPHADDWCESSPVPDMHWPTCSPTVGPECVLTSDFDVLGVTVGGPALRDETADASYVPNGLQEEIPVRVSLPRACKRPADLPRVPVSPKPKQQSLGGVVTAESLPRGRYRGSCTSNCT